MTKVRTNNRGAALLLFVIFFLIASTGVTLAISRTIYSDLLVEGLAMQSAQSYFTADSGIEDTAYRYIMAKNVSANSVITIGGATATTTSTYDGVDEAYRLTSRAVAGRSYRASTILLYVGSGVSFNFGVQSGNGGFQMSNSSSVLGNVFSNGTIERVGGGTATVYGDAISSGPTGLIQYITATGTARADTVKNSSTTGNVYAQTLDGGWVGGDAYYTTRLGGAVVAGNSYPAKPNPATTSMPIPDSEIQTMEQNVVNTGTEIKSTDPECAGGTYQITSSTTLGNVKIDCNLDIKKKTSAVVVTLNGTVWVTGDITLEGGPTMSVDPSVGARTVAVIADDPMNQATSSTIDIKSGAIFQGSGNPKSYVLMLSQNNDAENGSPNKGVAISVTQSSAGDLLIYAGHGEVSLGNSIALKEVTGYLISIGQSSQVKYESGLLNALFTTGPGGGYTMNGWQETY